MCEDPIVEEIRETRLQLEREAENDIDKLYQRALEIQSKVEATLVSKPLQKNSGVASGHV